MFSLTYYTNLVFSDLHFAGCHRVGSWASSNKQKVYLYHVQKTLCNSPVTQHFTSEAALPQNTMQIS